MFSQAISPRGLLQYTRSWLHCTWRTNLCLGVDASLEVQLAAQPSACYLADKGRLFTMEALLESVHSLLSVTVPSFLMLSYP